MQSPGGLGQKRRRGWTNSNQCHMSVWIKVWMGQSVYLYVKRNVRLCAYFLQELAELSAFGVSGAQILFGCHHCADAASVCILSWAVHLPPLLWPDGLHRGTQAQSWIQSPHACRQTRKINSVLMMPLLWNCGTQLWLSWHLWFDPHGRQDMCLMLLHCFNTNNSSGM